MRRSTGFVLFDAFAAGALGLSAVLGIALAPMVHHGRGSARPTACQAWANGDHLFTTGQKDFQDSCLIGSKANLPLDKDGKAKR